MGTDAKLTTSEVESLAPDASSLKGKLAASSALMTVLEQGEVLKQQCRAAVVAAGSSPEPV